MGRTKCVDIDSVYRKLCDAQENLKDALCLVHVALEMIPPPIRANETGESYDEPTYIGEEDGREEENSV